MSRYHKEVGFPVDAEQLIESYLAGFESIGYSTHAKYATIRDRHGIIPVLQKSDLETAECFELVVEFGRVAKAVFRVSGYDVDYCYSVSAEGAVVTCWANTKEDSHRTLDKLAYAQVS